MMRFTGSIAVVLFAIAAQSAFANESFRFAVVGHVRGGPDNGNIPREKFARLTAELRAQELAFVVLTGDIVWGDFEAGEQVDADAVRRDWETVDALLAEVGVPIHHVPGNHDVWDPTTRDIWVERYQSLYRAFDLQGCRFVLLNSCWTPTGDSGRTPGKYIRGVQLPADQVEFVREQMNSSRDARHVFVFMHHLLWWERDAAWWRDVHPLLSAAPTRAVFGGDMGPWKFSRDEADGIHYVQTAVDFTDRPPLKMLRDREGSRAIVTQVDNYVVVSVDGPNVEYELRTLGAFEGQNFSPQAWRDIYAFDEGTLARKVFNRMNTPARSMEWIVRIAAGAFVGGLLVAGGVAWLVGRRRRAKR